MNSSAKEVNAKMMLSERQMDRLTKVKRNSAIVATILKSVEHGGMDFEDGLILCIEGLWEHSQRLEMQLANSDRPRITTGSDKAEMFSDIVSRSLKGDANTGG